VATRWQLVERARFAPKRRWEDGFPNLRLESRPEMNERWLPVLAAALGFFGGVAGAAVGGYVANEGQERRFEAERAARLRVLRTEAYRTFLRAAEREREDYNRDNTLPTRPATRLLWSPAVRRSGRRQHNSLRSLTRTSAKTSSKRGVRRSSTWQKQT
jgi:hypothetical protein